MKRQGKWAFFACLCLAAALAGCKAVSGQGGEDPLPRPPDAKPIIVFDANGGLWADGTEDAKQIEQASANVTLPGEEPSKTGTAFIGWYPAQEADIPEYGALPDEAGVSADTPYETAIQTLYARYKSTVPGQVLVVFTVFQQGNVVASETVREGDAIDASKIPATVTRTHYTRDDDKWYTAEGEFDFTQPLIGITTVTVFAKWTGVTYTVSFDKNNANYTGGGATPANIVKTYPEAISAGEIPVMADPHHTFDGWYTLSNGTGTKLAAGLVTETKKYYAKWIPNVYSVTFKANGGKFGAPNQDKQELSYQVTYPGKQTTTPTVTHSSFLFERWSSKADNSGAAWSAATVITADTEYYAIWKLPENGLNIEISDSDQPWLGDTATISIARTGYYKIELWGAQGGPAGTGNPANFDATTYTVKGAAYSYKGEPFDAPSGYMSGGRGAYVSGHILLNQGDTIVLRIGGARIEKTDTSSGGGFNGGGSGYSSGAGAGDGAGGGATDLRFGGNDLRHRILVAGGGGGSSDGRLGGTGSAKGLWKGGFATIFGETDQLIGGGNGVGHDPGRGAWVSSGGAKPSNNGQSGTWGYGGNAAGQAESYGAGGGGWFGGSSGGQNNSNGSGGGGNSYISGIAGFIACAEGSTDVPPPAAVTWSNVKGGFIQKTTAGTPEQIATSWTGKVFTHPVYKAGNEDMPKPDGTGTETGHEGPGTAKIKWLGNTDGSDNGD